MEFKKFNGTKVDLVDYTNEYLETHEGIEIMVGTDSQNRGKETVFCTVVAFYDPGHGAHCIFRKWKTPRFRKEEMDRRLMSLSTLTLTSIRMRQLVPMLYFKLLWDM